MLENIWNNKVIVFILFLFFFGIFNIYQLPIYEGFDEEAHFSRIRDIGLNGKSSLDSLYIDKFVTHYPGPKYFSTGQPPFDKNLTYNKFFKNNEAISNYSIFIKKTPPSEFNPSDEINWINQHPRFYYELTGKVYSLSKNFSFFNQVMLQRFLSVLMVCFSIFLIFLYIHKDNTFLNNQNKKQIILGFIVFPFLFPTFFVEFFRITNDSLVLFLFSILIFINLFYFQNIRGKLFYSVLIGVVLGYGLLTKAFFVPIFIIYLVCRLLIYFLKLTFKHDLMYLLITFGVALFISYDWVYDKYLNIFLLSGGVEGQELIDSNLSIHELFFYNFDFFSMIRGFIVPLASFSWSGTFSLVRIDFIIQFLYACLLMLVIFISLRSFFIFLKNKTLLNITLSDVGIVFIVFTILSFIFGIFLHVFMSMMSGRIPTTPGWYIHTIFPALVFAFSPAIFKLYSILNKKFFNLLLCLYFLLGYIFIKQSLLFTGFLIKGVDKTYTINNDFFSSLNLAEYALRLEILSNPLVLIISLGVSILFASRLLILIAKIKG
jgi:hypothetical protein